MVGVQSMNSKALGFIFHSILLFLFPEPDELKSMQQLAVYLRRWRPSTFTLDPFQEVVLSHQSVEELRQKVHLGRDSGVGLEGEGAGCS